MTETENDNDFTIKIYIDVGEKTVKKNNVICILINLLILILLKIFRIWIVMSFCFCRPDNCIKCYVSFSVTV